MRIKIKILLFSTLLLLCGAIDSIVNMGDGLDNLFKESIKF